MKPTNFPPKLVNKRLSRAFFSVRPGTKWPTDRYQSADLWLGNAGLGGMMFAVQNNWIHWFSSVLYPFDHKTHTPAKPYSVVIHTLVTRSTRSSRPKYASPTLFTDGRGDGYARIDFVYGLRLWVLKTIHPRKVGGAAMLARLSKGRSKFTNEPFHQ